MLRLLRHSSSYTVIMIALPIGPSFIAATTSLPSVEFPLTRYFHSPVSLSFCLLMISDQLQMSWRMTRQQDMIEDEPQRCGFAKWLELPSLPKRGGGRFSLCLSRVSCAPRPASNPPCPPLRKGSGLQDPLFDSIVLLFWLVNHQIA